MLLYHNVVVHTQTKEDGRRLVVRIKCEFQCFSVPRSSCVHIIFILRLWMERFYLWTDSGELEQN